ncbi:MAG: hypothetical protein MMC33_000598 [Icmadophila ericetorum]|nr:hypothetical protein [Icmadophila ericetorum]
MTKLTDPTQLHPLTAIDLASSVVQLVDFGLKVARRLSDYNNARPREVPKSLQSINSQLPLLLHSLSRLRTETEVERIDVNTKFLLRGVISGCMRLVEEVEDIINKLSSIPGEAFSVKLRKVLSSIKNDGKVQALDRNLETYIQVLILHHVVDAADFPPPAPEERSYFEVHEKRVSTFTERDNLMQKLESALYDAARSLTKFPTVVVLSGVKGAGKTQLALEYCYQANFLGHFRSVFWINASTQENVCLGLESIAATVRQSNEGSRTEKINQDEGWLCMSQAVIHECEDILDMLLAHGANPQFLPDGRSPLECAASISAGEGSISIFRNFLDHDGATGYVPQIEENEAMFQAAAEKGNAEILQLLLARCEVRLNSTDLHGRTSLYRASRNGRTEVGKLLLKHGADSTLLVDGEPRYNCLIAAAACNHLETVQVLCEHDKRNINVFSHESGYNGPYSGHTALYEVVAFYNRLDYIRCDTEIIKFLLEMGADPNADRSESARYT